MNKRYFYTIIIIYYIFTSNSIQFFYKWTKSMYFEQNMISCVFVEHLDFLTTIKNYKKVKIQNTSNIQSKNPCSSHGDKFFSPNFRLVKDLRLTQRIVPEVCRKCTQSRNQKSTTLTGFKRCLKLSCNWVMLFRRFPISLKRHRAGIYLKTYLNS